MSARSFSAMSRFAPKLKLPVPPESADGRIMRSPAPIVSPSVMIVARSRTLRNSRTLPGHS